MPITRRIVTRTAGLATAGALAVPLLMGTAGAAPGWTTGYPPPVYVSGGVASQPTAPAYSGSYVANVGGDLAAHHWHHVVYMNRLAEGRS